MQELKNSKVAITTRSEAQVWLENVVSAKDKLDSCWDDFCDCVSGSADSPLGLAVWKPMQLLLDCVSELLNDEDDAINWFVWDNDCGKNGLQHSLPNGDLRKILTIHDLLDVLGYTSTH